MRKKAAPRSRKAKSRKSGGTPLVPFVIFGFILLMFFAMRGTERPAPAPAAPKPVRSAPAPKPAPPRQTPKPAPKVAPVPPQPVPIPPPAPALSFPPGRGKIAIVLDDWGYTMKQVPALESIRRPLTIAVLPSLPHSADVARAAKGHGHEVILHMPMEALDPNAPKEAVTLLTTMPRQRVVEILDRSIRSVPSLKGISNHQGSKGTSNAALMEIVMRESKRRGLYFLDSYVTNQSVGADVARKVRIPFAQRTIFLDNEQTAPAIQQQLAHLAQIASQKGEAVGIGHDRPMMLEVLKKAVPALEKAGYTLVPASELTEIPESSS